MTPPTRSAVSEEGELPPSDDEDLPKFSRVPVINTGLPQPTYEKKFQPAASVNKNPGVHASKQNYATFMEYRSKASVMGSLQRITERNQVPVKPIANDLVISFSDNDSSSGYDDSREEKKYESGNKKMLAPAQKLSKTIQQTARSKTKPFPTKSINHTYFPSTKKGQNKNIMNQGSSIWQGFGVKNFKAPNKNKYVARPERPSSQTIGMNNNKLSELRQQIAMREKELKIKSSLQSKERVSGSNNDDTIRNLKNDARGNPQLTSTGTEHSNPDLLDRNLIKANDASFVHLSSKEPSTSNFVAASKDFAIYSKCYEKNVHSSCQLNANIPQDPIARAMPSSVTFQKQDDLPVSNLNGSIPSEGNEGGHIIVSCSPSKRNPALQDPIVQNRTDQLSNDPFKPLLRSSTMGLIHSKENEVNPPSNYCPSWKTYERSHMRNSENHEKIIGDKILLPVSGNFIQACSVDRADNEMKESLKNGTADNHLDDVNSSPHGIVNVQSFVEIEEMQDRELEDAQEHRRRCEVEEIKALKDFRRAQRALIEANNRCTYLYHQRGLYTAQYQSLITDNSSLLFSSGQQNRIVDVSKSAKNLAPTLKHQTSNGCNSYNQPGDDSVVQFAKGNLNLHNASNRNVDVQNLCSEPCSEPDASTSELLQQKHQRVANEDCSPSIDHSIEDGETYPPGCPGHLYVLPNNMNCQESSESKKRREELVNDGLKVGVLVDTIQDSLRLEESLRSALVARLGKRSANNICSTQVVEPALKRRALNDVRGKKSQKTTGSGVVFELDCNQPFDQEDSDQHYVLDGRNELCISVACSSLKTISISPILVSVFSHWKDPYTMSFTGSRNQNKHDETSSLCNGDVVHAYDNGQFLPGELRENAMHQIVSENAVNVIDPFWPLCMFELRGKCNNEECPWQHTKDFSNTVDPCGSSICADSHAGSLSHNGKLAGATEISKHLNNQFDISPPTYSVFLDNVTAKLHANESIFASGIGNSASFDIPRLLGEASNHEVHGSCNRLSLYFQSRNSDVVHIKKGMVDSDQTLELAFHALNHCLPKSKGMDKALETLARALEMDPTCTILWVVYLHILYSDKKPIGKHDMFFYAVKYNGGCYELWLLYISSRVRLDDRFVAYDTALSALSHHASSFTDITHASACILDLFLQLLDLYCVSGNVEKAIHNICGYFLTNDSDSNLNVAHSLPLSDVVSCLTVSDKSIFWACCVYLVMYRKLPDKIIERFELPKHLYPIEWPSVDLTINEKERAIKLMDFAVDSVALCGNGNDVRCFQMFAVNHVRCMTTLSGLECGLNLLDRYVDMYPTCLELVLIWARAQKHGSEAFEEVLSKWPKEAPGWQCVWNQYAEFLLRDGGRASDLAKQVMIRWFKSVFSDVAASGNTSIQETLGGMDHIDAMFGFINLCLYHFLQDDSREACSVINAALEFASPKKSLHKEIVFCHLLRAHLHFQGDDGDLLKVANRYLVGFHESVLSRKFIADIKKPRLQALLNGLLRPVSSDFSVLNLVLKTWYGPSLIPRNCSLKNLVDFVEAVMEISPSNYEIPISVCNALKGDSNPKNITFWAVMLLVNSVLKGVPFAPVFVWVEGLDILKSLGDVKCQMFFVKRGLCVHPFSVELWKCFFNLSKSCGSDDDVVGMARERGITLDLEIS